MTLSVLEIVNGLKAAELLGDPSVRIEGVTHDSRKVRPGWLFVAVPGATSDGHDFVDRAIESGAAAVLAERPCPFAKIPRVPWIRVPSTRMAMGPASAMVYGNPTSKMIVVGITGTNGKTSLTYILESVIEAAGGSPGVVGTVSYRWAGQERNAPHTTPEASDLQAMLAEMADAGVTHALMEVSSHGLSLGRLEGCKFDLGVFTNLTQDHLDYHRDLEHYFLAKLLLFDRLLPASSEKKPKAAVNLDDTYGRRLADSLSSIPVIGYGRAEEALIRPLDVSLTAAGISGTLQTSRGPVALNTSLAGEFNLQNVMAAVAVCEGLGVPVEAVERGLRSMDTVPGRLERIDSARGTIFVDYAHTPNALKNVLDALNTIRSGRIVTIMGCGGDRDKTKRPVMGMEAAAGSDFLVITSDNPRTEDPDEIIRQVEEGVRGHGRVLSDESEDERPLRPGRYRIISDRREAIAWAVERLEPGDILLVAGKGHETYQETKGVRRPFDDREVVREELRKHGDLIAENGSQNRGEASEGSERQRS